MEVKELKKIQEEFSKKAFPKFWEIINEKDFLLRLEFLSNALNGEAGELANLIKKLVRDKIYLNKNVNTKEYIEKIKEEIIDVFIYILNLSILLNFDLEKEFLKKLEINKKRFLE